MIYSVCNQGARQYDYYRTAELQETANTPAPKHIRATKLGATVEQAAWPLPASAQKVGSGEYAQGRIASNKAVALVGFTMDTNMIGFLGFGLAAFLLWRSGYLKS